MRTQLLKSACFSTFTVLCVGSLLRLIWYAYNSREVIKQVVTIYSQTWKKQEDNYENLKFELNRKCRGFDRAIVTQDNTPMGSKLLYDGDRRKSLVVTSEIFKTFPKEDPFPNKMLDTCAVVGNGGILSNSSCGTTIDAAEFVFRCNLPPLENGYERDVGTKTNLVTANPSIVVEKHGSLMGRRRPFVESLRKYGNSLLLLPAFSFGSNTPVSMRVVYSIEDFESSVKAVSLNPHYLQSLAAFWRSQGLKEVRLSTGLMMVSLALEHCTNVELYGFWPFSYHPEDLRHLTNHYYDDRRATNQIHALPTEFNHLLGLHSQGVLRLHLGQC
ncbi:alpha-2,8-sialyltransferase 8F isoform X2 [Betta splendens]|uniref:Alpha-2,8-sialyltransferase 8F isoform X2 n=1 Tax=Betta splendens TaxID=158456 RepID=A0A6P7N9Z4_BETSP|nr:alpha-2,8-sialyltransferase 8F isoform X2 [Betta splendens]